MAEAEMQIGRCLGRVERGFTVFIGLEAPCGRVSRTREVAKRRPQQRVGGDKGIAIACHAEALSPNMLRSIE
jgi:hypothetical protein